MTEKCSLQLPGAVWHSEDVGQWGEEAAVLATVALQARQASVHPQCHLKVGSQHWGKPLKGSQPPWKCLVCSGVKLLFLHKAAFWALHKCTDRSCEAKFISGVLPGLSGLSPCRNFAGFCKTGKCLTKINRILQSLMELLWVLAT